MNIEEAYKLCEENNIELNGELRYDPYVGWIDEYEDKYCILCELNEKEEDNTCNGNCKDNESCNIYRWLK